MWSDNETNIDLLDYRHLVGVILSIVKSKHLHPTTVGVYGHWGSGKSSLLKMAQKSVEDEVDGVLCINFNGWLFEGYDDAKSALMDTLLDAIAKETQTNEDVKGTLTKLSKRVNWMRVALAGGKLASSVLLGGIGLGVASGVEALARELASRLGDVDHETVKELLQQQYDEEAVLGIREFHSDFSELLETAKISTLVVFIDDLDRCNPETIIETLEAIKLFLFAPQTVFIIGADERLVEYAVTQRFPELPQRDFKIGRDYLEKLIQFPVRIPPVGQAELETYVHLLFTGLVDLDEETFDRIRLKAVEERTPGDAVNSFTFEMLREEIGNVTSDMQETLMLSQFIAPVLASGMSGNPRQTKRFLNTLMMRLEMAKARGAQIKSRVLAKLMLLEHFKFELFRALAAQQTQEQGNPKLLQIMETRLLSSIGSAGDIPDERLGAEDDSAPGLDVDTWIKDDWISKIWVPLEPQLRDVDLRPYFFFARETLNFATTQVRSLSPMAQRLVIDLLSDTRIVRNRALKQATDLDQAETTAIFREFAHRARIEESARTRTQLLTALIRFVEQRPELQSDLVTLLSDEPTGRLSTGIIPALEGMSKNLEDTSSELAIITKWSEKPDSNAVARYAKKRLGELSRGAL